MRKVVFDIETSNLFQDTGSNDAASLDLSVVCILDSDDGKYKSFLQKDLSELWPILEKTDLLIGFNSDHFDIPLLNKYYSGDLTRIKSLDLLKEVKNSLGRRIKLDTLAEATLGKKKSGHGLEATIWWKQGEYQKVIDYCIKDVEITKELYDFALKNKHLKYRDGDKLKEIPLKTEDWETESTESKLTHTLPF